MFSSVSRKSKIWKNKKRKRKKMISRWCFNTRKWYQGDALTQEAMTFYWYCDEEYGADLDKKRSITGMVFTFGGNLVSWRSSLQKVVALSTTEVHCIEWNSSGSNMAQGFYERVGFCLRPTQVDVFCDSQSDIALSRNAVLYGGKMMWTWSTTLFMSW